MHKEQDTISEMDMHEDEMVENYELQMEIEAEERKKKKKEPLPIRQLTDIGNAKSLVDRFGNGLKYAEDTKKWHIWHGTHWDSHCGAKGVNMMAEMTLDGIKDRINLSSDDPDLVRKVLAQTRKMEFNNRVTGMLERLKYQPKIGSHSTSFDKRTHLFCVENGTINLNTGELQKHNPKDMISHMAPVVYRPDADSHLLDAWLNWVTKGDKEYVAFLARAVGYSMLGHNEEEVLFFIYGETATGKSTFMNSIRKLFGNHAVLVDFKSFLRSSRPADSQRSDIAQMRGKRLVCSLEVKEGSTLAADIVKIMVGGDAMRGRLLYGETFSYEPQFALWLVANDAPKVGEQDKAMWRRIIRLPFDAKIPSSGADPLVKHDLNNMELVGSAWLNWALAGLKDYQEREGLDPPKVVRASTEEYRREQNPLRGFIQERLITVPSGKTPVAIVRAAYDRWCEENGVALQYRLAAATFNKHLEKFGAYRKKAIYSGASLNCWIGLTLQ